MSGLGVPEQDQIIDVEDQGSGARGRLGHPVLRIFKAQKLLDITEQLIHILPINIAPLKSRSTTDFILCVLSDCPSSGSMSDMMNPTMSCGARMADRWRCR